MESDFVPWLSSHLLFLTEHGSRAYGLNTASSDLDVKGICVPPSYVQHDLFHGFDQAENHPSIAAYCKDRINPNNPKCESVVYSLKKFFQLASQVNPNIIEVLFTAPESNIHTHPVAKKLIENRRIFLSARAKFTFSGYAASQLARINRHRKWILNPVTEIPKRSDFGLPETKHPSVEMLNREIGKAIESWNFNNISLTDTAQRDELKQRCWELVYFLSDKNVSWDNWPDEYWNGCLKKVAEQYGLREEIIALLAKEHEYALKLKNYHSYLEWQTTRNPERKALEEKYLYDTKHASQLIRLLRLGYEILTTGEVNVRRPDREELLSIRAGAWSYEKLLAESNEVEAKMSLAYKSTTLPRSVDYEKLNDLYYDLLEDWEAYSYNHPGN